MSKLLRQIVNDARAGEIIENRISLPISLIVPESAKREFNKVAGAFAEFIIADKYNLKLVGSGGSFPDLKTKDGKFWIEMKLGTSKTLAFIRTLGKGKTTSYDVYLNKMKKYNNIKAKGGQLWLMHIEKWTAVPHRPNQEDKMESPEVPTWFHIKVDKIRFINLAIIFEKDIWKTKIKTKSLTVPQLFKLFG